MSALAAALVLAAQVVTLKAADLPTKPVYVRVGVGVESRITLPDALVRLHGQRAASELLGLKLGQARPQAVLLLRPRAAGVGRLLFVGVTHSLRLTIEASALGSAQDVELRIATAEAPAPQAQPKRVEKQTPARAPAPARDGVARPPEPTPAPSPAASPAVEAGGATNGGTPAPATTPFGEPAPSAAPAPPAPPSAAAARPAPPAAPVFTIRIGRRVGLPGRQSVLVEELRRAGGEITLRARIQGGRVFQVVRLEIGGAQATVTTESAGRDLVVLGTIPQPAEPPHDATLVLVEAGEWHTVVLPLDVPGLNRFFEGGVP